jgi:hypothetical protein
MIYHLPFRDWMQLNTGQSIAAEEEDSGSDNGDGGR